MTDENGLYYMRARYYSPEIRRFVNQDILIGDIRDSQSLNHYAYAGGNPINYNDPFGLCRDRFLEGFHSTMDMLGWIPVVGTIFDAVNGLAYLSEGKYLDAGISLAGAFLDIGGQAITAGRMAKKAADVALNYGDDGLALYRRVKNTGAFQDLSELMNLKNVRKIAGG